MNWITNFVRPKINSMLGRQTVDTPENLWIKCPETGEMVFHKELEANKWVIPNSGYHMKMPAKERLLDLFDNGHYEALIQPKVPQDPLKFRDSKKYADRLRDGRTDSLQTSSLHLDILRDLKRINAHIVSVAHPILDEGGLLIESRLRS